MVETRTGAPHSSPMPHADGAAIMRGMTKHRLIALLAVLASLTLVPAATARSSASAARSAGASACAASKLVVWLDTTGNGAAGSVYYTLEFTNLSPHSCTLEGYPGVSAVSLVARQLGSAAGRSHQVAARVVTLATGATANAVLQITQAANYPASTCHQVTAAGLRVYPPGSTRAKLVPFPFGACSRRGPVILHVGAATSRK
jgi:hypothetical protein